MSKALEAKLNKIYAPSAKIEDHFRGNDLLFYTNENGEPYSLYIGKRNESGNIVGEYYIRKISGARVRRSKKAIGTTKAKSLAGTKEVEQSTGACGGQAPASKNESAGESCVVAVRSLPVGCLVVSGNYCSRRKAYLFQSTLAIVSSLREAICRVNAACSAAVNKVLSFSTATSA